MKVDVNCDFTLDTPNFWDNYWDGDCVLGKSAVDPDFFSRKLFELHKEIYSRELPNGAIAKIEYSQKHNCLIWDDFRFGNDSIATSFRNKNNRMLITNVAKELDNYQKFVEHYVHTSYTLGGEIIFPKRKNSINQARGCNRFIRDRWDLTLECIRLYYDGIESPLFSTLDANKNFFDLFVDFKGYIDFFFLQDYVSEDCKSVNIILGEKNFAANPVPKTVEEYIYWMKKQEELIDKRNQRIQNFFSDKNPTR